MGRYIGKLLIRSRAAKELKVRSRNCLTLTADDSAGLEGTGVITYAGGEILDCYVFRTLRDTLGASIETKDPEKVCRILGVPLGEPGIVAEAVKSKPLPRLSKEDISGLLNKTNRTSDKELSTSETEIPNQFASAHQGVFHERIAQLLRAIAVGVLQQMDVLKEYRAGVMTGKVTPEQVLMILADLDRSFRLSRKRLKELQNSEKT